MTDAVGIPTALAHLPVASQVSTIDFDAPRFICRASTGTGKTVILPALEITMRKARGENAVVLLRQPTKLTVQYCQSSIAKFWPELKIGVSTRDEKRDIETADIVVISDGSLGGVLEKLKGRTVIYYIDEAHAPVGAATEIEWGVAKKLGLSLRFLSATVDEKPLVNYLGGNVPVYNLEGRTFPIEKDIEVAPRGVFDREDHDELVERLREHIIEAKFDDDGILIFVPTRKMAEEMAAKFRDDLPTKFAHGGVHPAELESWTNERQGEAFAVFATTAAAMGITIGNVGRVVVCDQVVDSEVRFGIERQFTSQMPDNLLLQAIGRCGRIKPGKATLLTESSDQFNLRTERDWGSVVPRPIIGPCSKTTPYQVILALASYGIRRNEDIDLYSKLDIHELQHAREELIAMRCLTPDGDMASMGRLIQATPLEPHMAHLVHTSPGRQARLVVAAAVTLSGQGTYQMVTVKPRTREHNEVVARNPSFKMLPTDCVHIGSAPMTLAHILQATYRHKRGNDLGRWARSCNLNERVLNFATYDFEKIASTVSDSPVDDLLAVNFADHDLDLAVDEHVACHRTMRRTYIDGSWGKITVGTNRFGCTIDSVLMEAFEKRAYWGDVTGMVRIIKSNKTGSEFVSIEMPVLHGLAPVAVRTTPDFVAGAVE